MYKYICKKIILIVWPLCLFFCVARVVVTYVIIKRYVVRVLFKKAEIKHTYRVRSHIWHEKRIFLYIVTARELEKCHKRKEETRNRVFLPHFREYQHFPRVGLYQRCVTRNPPVKRYRSIDMTLAWPKLSRMT